MGSGLLFNLNALLFSASLPFSYNSNLVLEQSPTLKQSTMERDKTFFAVQIKETEINILQKKWGRKLFLSFKIEEKNYF